MNKMGRLKDKVAIVTGGATGIGKTICLTLAEEGAKVVINHFNTPKEAIEVNDEINSKGGISILSSADVTKGKEVEKMVEEVDNKFGRIDILVNNAGIIKDSLLLSMEEKDWDSVINVNLGGVFHCTKTVVKYMILQKEGVIINISSVAAEVGGKGYCNYVTSKGGINSFTKAMATELANKGIRVNAVSPGIIVSKISEHLRKSKGDKLLDLIPMKRFGTQREVAKVVAFLVSDDASYITGEIIHVTGGFGLGF